MEDSFCIQSVGMNRNEFATYNIGIALKRCNQFSLFVNLKSWLRMRVHGTSYMHSRWYSSPISHIDFTAVYRYLWCKLAFYSVFIKWAVFTAQLLIGDCLEAQIFNKGVRKRLDCLSPPNVFKKSFSLS